MELETIIKRLSHEGMDTTTKVEFLVQVVTELLIKITALESTVRNLDSDISYLESDRHSHD